MKSNIAMRAGILVLLGVVAAAFLFGGTANSPKGAQAASPGATVSTLLSCPNVDASADNGVRVSDILAVVNAYHKDWPATNYTYLYDLAGPYNPQTGTGGAERVDDILVVVAKYHMTCPLVDTQVAAATRWGLDMDLDAGNGMQPVPQLESEAAIEAIGYYQGSSDVPGQGTHYIKIENWDGTFNPAAPEGLVYQNGRFAAQLYVVDGNAVGWGTHEAFSPPGPTTPHGVDLEGDADGPQCSPACSWDGANDGWHLHYYLCTINNGTSSALAISAAIVPSVGTESGCQSYSGGNPLCTSPITAQPCYRWAPNTGWMGHLWNWLPNANQITDVGGTNGRFADCFPDTQGWKAFNCPA